MTKKTNLKRLRFGVGIATATTINICCASNVREDYYVKNNLGNYCLDIGPAPSDQMHSVTFAVKHKDSKEMDRILSEISSPINERYGKYLTNDEVAELTVEKESVLFIQSYLQNVKEVTVKKQSLYGEYITVEASVSVWNEIFRTDMRTFRNKDSPTETATRAYSYYLPRELADHISGVFHLIDDPFAVRKISPKRSEISGKEIQQLIESNKDKMNTLVNGIGSESRSPAIIGYTYPQLLWNHYSMFTNEGNINTKQAVFATADQSYSDYDLATFQHYFNLPFDKVRKNVGGHVYKGPCGNWRYCFESNLDIQYLTSTAQLMFDIFWYESDKSSSSFTLFLMELNNEADPPKVISISYGMSEGGLMTADKVHFDREAKKLALKCV
jgi:subtilase family serine protease